MVFEQCKFLFIVQPVNATTLKHCFVVYRQKKSLPFVQAPQFLETADEAPFSEISRLINNRLNVGFSVQVDFNH